MSVGERTVLALDLGDVRIGLARSESLGLIAQPLGFVPRVGPRRDLSRIVDVVREHDAGTVVVGLPLLLSGEEGARARAAREFVEQLRSRLPGVSVELWDERLTTLQAERTMIDADVRRRKRKLVVDSLAAVLILQSWLDARGARR